MPIDHLPAKYQPAARRLRGWCMGDAPALIILGVSILARGVSYTPPLMSPHAQATHPAEGALTMPTWGVVWIAVGLACIASAWWPRATPFTVGAGVGLNVLWGLSFIADAIVDGSPRGWVPAVSYLTIALLIVWAVWRGHREPELHGEEIRDALRRD